MRLGLKRAKAVITLLTLTFLLLFLALAGAAGAWTQGDVEKVKDKVTTLEFEKAVSESPENTTYLPDPYAQMPGRSILDPDPPLNELVLVRVNTASVFFPDQRPYIDENERTMVPIRFVAQELGARVSWDESTRTVGIIRGATDISLKIGESQAVINGELRTFDTQAVITPQGRTMVPLRFVSEVMGAKVEWEPQFREVFITLP